MAGYTKCLASHPPPVTLELPQECCHPGCLPDCLFHPNAEVFTSASLLYSFRPPQIFVPWGHSSPSQWNQCSPETFQNLSIQGSLPSSPSPGPSRKQYPVSYGLVMLTQPMMELSLRTHIAGAGLQSANYGTHSLRRGGASWAFQSGMPAKLIKVFGGWESNCYQIYLDMTLDTKFQMMKHFVK